MVFDFIGSWTGMVFAPLTAFQPHIALFIFTVFITLLIVFINKFAVNKKKMREMKDNLTAARENLTKAQKEGNKEETNKFLSEYMRMNSQYMKKSFKAIFISIIVIILFLPWAGKTYSGMLVAKLPFTLPFIGSTFGWLAWYFLVSLAIGWVVRKWLGE